MNIVSSPIQSSPAISVATDIRSPIDETDLGARSNPIPPTEEAQAESRLGERNPQQAVSAEQESVSTEDGEESAGAAATADLQLSESEQDEVAQLSARDREVRAHEAAHSNAGGRFAGAPSYTFKRGPDGNSYAVGGEVSIDVAPIAGNPEATIQKAQIVRRAALAPAQPSSQDRAVAAEAASIELAARQELLAAQAEQSQSADSELGSSQQAVQSSDIEPESSATENTNNGFSSSGANLFEQVAGLPATEAARQSGSALVDLLV